MQIPLFPLHNRHVTDRHEAAADGLFFFFFFSPLIRSLGRLSLFDAAAVQSEHGYYGNSGRREKALTLITST